MKKILGLVFVVVFFGSILWTAHVDSIENVQLWASLPGDEPYKATEGVWDIDSHTATFAIVGKDGTISYWDTEVPFDSKTGEVNRYKES